MSTNAVSIYRAERSRRPDPAGLPSAAGMVTLRHLAERARLTRRAMHYHLSRGHLVAKRVRCATTGWQWGVEPEEVRRFLRTYTRWAKPARRKEAA